jgi:lysophospholipase
MNAPSYSWISNALKLNEYLQSEGWQKITTPMLLFQARHDTFVSKREQNRFIRKIAANQNAKLVRVPGVKHEILNATDDILEIYWKKIYSFLQK